MVCNNCGKEFNLDEGYAEYGLNKGRAFYLILCPECKELLSDRDKEKMINKIFSKNLGDINMEREIYSIKLRGSDKKALVTSYVRGSEQELKDFMVQVYGKQMSEKMETIKLTEKGKFKFPWNLTQKVLDLEPIYKISPIDKNIYLARIQDDFFIGSKEEIDKYPPVLLKVFIKISEVEQAFLDKKVKFDRLNSNWKKAVGNLRKIKKFWNSKVTVK